MGTQELVICFPMRMGTQELVDDLFLREDAWVHRS